MAWRWVLCPFGQYTIDYGDSLDTAMRAKVGTLKDPGTNKYYQYRPVLHIDRGKRTWSLVLVQGVDFTPLTVDPEIDHLFEGDMPTDPAGFLALTPADLGWTNPRLNRIRTRIQKVGGDTTGLTATTPLYDWLRATGLPLDPNFDPADVFIFGTLPSTTMQYTMS